MIVCLDKPRTPKDLVYVPSRKVLKYSSERNRGDYTYTDVVEYSQVCGETAESEEDYEWREMGRTERNIVRHIRIVRLTTACSNTFSRASLSAEPPALLVFPRVHVLLLCKGATSLLLLATGLGRRRVLQLED